MTPSRCATEAFTSADVRTGVRSTRLSGAEGEWTSEDGVVAGCSVEVRRLGGEEWTVLREVRLRALADAPGVFGASLGEARRRGEGSGVLG